jgi:hypothetical protein
VAPQLSCKKTLSFLAARRERPGLLRPGELESSLQERSNETPQFKLLERKAWYGE